MKNDKQKSKKSSSSQSATKSESWNDQNKDNNVKKESLGPNTQR